jgi:glucose-1-phosphatase
MKTIFFDFGNVIGFFDHWQSVRRLQAYTPLAPEDLFDALYDNALEDRYERGAMSTPEYIAAAIAAGSLTCDVATFYACFKDIFTPNPEVCDAIALLAPRYRLLLASNTNDGHFRHYCEQFRETLRHFAALPTSHRALARKPEPAFYAYCQTFADAAPNECVFVDDLPRNIVAAEEHGFRGLLYTPGNLAAGLRAHGIAF